MNLQYVISVYDGRFRIDRDMYDKGRIILRRYNHKGERVEGSGLHRDNIKKFCGTSEILNKRMTLDELRELDRRMTSEKSTPRAPSPEQTDLVGLPPDVLRYPLPSADAGTTPLERAAEDSRRAQNVAADDQANGNLFESEG